MDRTVVRDKMLGCLYGQAIGDALGLGSEFMSKDEVVSFYPNGLNRYEQIIQDRHRKRWTIGAWTDDTDMMLCILNGCVNGKFDCSLIAHNFKSWFKGSPMGIGSHTYKVLSLGDYVNHPFKASEVIWKLSHCNSAANGALMRTSIVGLQKDISEHEIEQICQLTHYDSRCVGSCVIASLIINNLIWNSKELSLPEIIHIANKYDSRIVDWIERAYRLDIADLHLDDYNDMGYTLKTLSAALWLYFHDRSFECGLQDIVNQGGDADTNAAVACAILGAKLGFENIPSYYVDNLNKTAEYRSICDAYIDTQITEI